jgi:hypothetical protein
MTNTTRFDIYGLIHKALRADMGETLTAVGRMDALDDGETSATLARVRSLLALARAHLEHENDFVHQALEARRPGSSAATAQDHVRRAPPRQPGCTARSRFSSPRTSSTCTSKRPRTTRRSGPPIAMPS